MIFARHIRQSGVLFLFAIVLVLIPARYASAQAGDVLVSITLSEGVFRTTQRAVGQLRLPAGSTAFRSQDTNGMYGEFSLKADGNWAYALDNARKAVQALIPSDDARDEFRVRVPDGGGGRVVGIVRILITGVLEPVTGARNFSITEDAPGGETVSGRLNWAFGDSLLNVDRAGGIWGPATMQGAFGAFVMEDRRGNWHYTLNTNGAETQALRDGDSPVEEFTFSPDETDLYESVTFRITVEGRNDPPIVTMAQADQAIVRAGETVRLSGAAIDIDNLEQDTLVYTWFSDPSTAGVFADRGSPNTTWTAPSGVIETAYTLSLRVRDVHGGSGLATVVLDGDSVPVFGIEFFPPRYYFKMEQTINPPPLPAARGGDGVLSYSVRPTLPLGMGFNAHTRRLTGIPRTSLGDRRYTYRATDANGDVVSKSFAITVYPTTFRPGVVFNRFVGGDLFGTVTPTFGERVTSGRFLLLETTGRKGPGFFAFAEQQGDYGTLTIKAGGEWSYRVDHAAPNVVEVPQGQRVKEIFLIQPDPSTPYTSSVLVIEITGTNENPTVNATASRSSAPVGGAIRVSGTATDADLGDLAGMVYSWSVSPASSGGSFVDRRARDATYIMGSRGVGVRYTLSLRATDAAGGVGTGRVVVTQGAREANLVGELNLGFTEDEDGGGGDDETKAGAVSHPLRAATQNGVYGEFEVRASDATQWSYTLRRDRAVVQALRAGEEVMERFRLRPVNGGVTGAFATVTISGANDPPVAHVGEAPASSPVDVPITLSGSGSDADAGEQAGLVYAWSTSPAGFGRFADDNVSAPRAVWTPAMQGVVTLRLRVEDAQGAVREDSMILTVGPGPPQLGGVHTGEVTEDAEPGTASGMLAYQNPLAGIDMVFNPQTVDGRYGVLVLTADGAWAYTLNDNQADLLNGLDSVLDVFDVQAGFDPVAETFVTSAPGFIQITIHGVNDPPQLSITAPASVPSASEHLVTGSATDPDRGHQDSLVYAWSTAPAGIGTFTDAAALSTPWSAPSVDVATTVTLRLTARDPGGAVATAVSPPVTINPVTPAGDNILFFATMDEMDPGTPRPAERIEQRLSLPDGFIAFVEQHGRSDFGRLDLEPNGEFRYIQLISTREVQQLVPGDLTHDDFTLRGVRAGDRSKHSLGILRVRILGKLEPVTGRRVFGFTEDEFGDLRTPRMPRGTRVEGILDWDLGDNLLRVDRRGGIWNPDVMNGRFGVFEMLDERGNWRYILEPQRAAVQALVAGQRETDRIVVHPYTPLYEPVVFEFRVHGVFDTPTATAMADRSVVRPGEVVSLSGRGGSEDASELQTLAFTWYALPAVGVFADRNALETTWTAPQEMLDGSYRLVLRVRDTTGVTGQSGVTLRADSAPYFGNDYATTDYVFQEQRTLNTAPLPAALSGSGEVRYKVTPALPAGLSFERVARRLTGRPLAVLDEPRTYTYTAADANGDTDALQFTIMIVPRTATRPAPLSHYIGGDLRGTLRGQGSSVITSPGTRSAVGTLRFFRPDGSPASDVGFEETEQDGAYGTFFLGGVRGQEQGFWVYRSGTIDPAGNSVPPEALVPVPGRVLVRDEFVVHSTRPALYPPATVVIMVEGLNDRPSVKLTANRSQAPAGAVINLGGRATDPDSGESETLSYTWSVLGFQGGSFADRRALETTYTVGDRGVGAQYTLVLRATDQTGGEGGDSIIITQTAEAGTVLSGDLEGAVTEDAPDVSTGGFVSLLLRGVDKQGIYGRFRVVGGSAEWSYTLDSRLPSVQALAAGEQQQETFAISPRDSGVASVNVVITVTGVNDPLTAEIIAPADAVRVFSGETVTLIGRGNDPDSGDILEYLWGASDGLGIFANAAVSETTWIAPKVEEETNVVLSLRVDDGRLSDTERTVVTVSPPPPQAALAFVGEVVSEGNYIAGAAINPRTLPVAIGGVGELRYAITPALPGGLSFDEASRVLSGTPHALASAITTAYAYTVTDQSGAAARLTFDITVSPAGVAPGFQNGAAIPAQRYIPDVAITPLTLPAATGGDGALRYDIRPEPPSGLSFDAANRVLSGVPDTPQRSFIYYYTATDSASSSASLNFAIAVAVPDVPPVFPDAAAIPAQSYKAREAIIPVTLPEAVAGNGVLRYHITPELPDGLFFDAAGRVLFGTPHEPRDLATYAYTATDSDTNLSLVFDAALLRFTITIAEEDLAPAFPNGVTIPDQEYTTNVSIPALNLPAGAGGDGALSYSLSPELPRGLRYDPERRRVIGTPFTIIGSPPPPTTYTWTVTDEDGDTDTLRFVIRITVPPFTIIAAVGYISEDAMVLETATGNEPPGRHNLASWDRRRNNDRLHKYGRFTLRANGDWHFNLIPAGSVERLEIQKLGPGETLHADFRLVGFRSDGSRGFPGDFRILIQGAAEPIIGRRNFTLNEEDSGSDAVIRGRLNWDYGREFEVERNGGIWNRETRNGRFGLFEMLDERGNWRYTLNPNAAVTQSLQDGDAPRETFVLLPYTPLYESVTFGFTVTGANDAPQVTMAQADRTVVQPGDVVRLRGAATDADRLEQETLAYTWFTDPAMGVFDDSHDPNTNWHAPRTMPEDGFTLTLRVRDVRGAFDEAVLRLDPDSAPAFGTDYAPDAYIFKVGTAVDVAALPPARGGNGVVRYSLRPGAGAAAGRVLPRGLSFDAAARRLTGTPQVALSEAAAWTYVATDDNGDTDTLQFTIMVVPKTAPNPPSGSRYIGGPLYGTVTPAFGERTVFGVLSLNNANGRAADGGAFIRGVQDGDYGALTVTDPSGGPGRWEYRVDHILPEVVALRPGRRLREQFTITTNRPQVYPAATLVIDILGANRVPDVRVTANRSTAPVRGAILVSGMVADANDEDLAGVVYSWSVEPAALGGRFVDRRARDTIYVMGDRGAGAKYTLSLRVTDQHGGVGTGNLVVTQIAAAGRLRGDFSSSFIEDGVKRTEFNVVSHDLSVRGEDGVYGRFDVLQRGLGWNYTLDGRRAAVQALGAGRQAQEQFRLEPAQGDISGAFATITITGVNDAPVAAITGAPASLAAGGAVTLDGGGSSDPDAGESATLDYAWSTVPLNTGVFDDARAVRPVWTAATAPGGVTLRLRVTDAQGAAATTTTGIRVTPAPAAIVAESAADRGGALREDGGPQALAGRLRYINPPDFAGFDAIFHARMQEGGYGVFVIAEDGAWTYTLNDDNDALRGRDVVEDAFGVEAGLDLVSGNYANATPDDFIRITIRGQNDVPQVTVTTPAAALQSASAQEHQVAGDATDPDFGHQAALSYAWSTAPANIGVFANPNAASTTWSAPSVDAPLTVTLRFRARDPDGATGSGDSAVITVNPVRLAGDRILLFRTMDELDPGAANNKLTGRLDLSGFDSVVARDMESEFSRFILRSNGEWEYIQRTGTKALQALVPDDIHNEDYRVRAQPSDGSPVRTIGFLRFRIFGQLEAVTGPRTGAFSEDDGGDQAVVSGRLNWKLGDGLLRVDRNGGIWNRETRQGRFGTFVMEDERGNWRYTLKGGRAQTQALVNGERPVERFVVAPYTPLYEPVIFEFTVRGVNDAPLVTARAGQVIVRAGDVVALSGAATDPDNPAIETLSHTWIADPAVGIFADRNSPDTTWTAPHEMREIIYTLRLRVRDSFGAGGEAVVRLDGDSVPFFGSDYVPRSFHFQAQRRIDIAALPEARGGDAPLRYRITPQLPAGLSFDGGTRRLSGTPRSPLDTPTTYTYMATDRNGDAATADFTLRIAPATAATPPPSSRYISGDLHVQVTDASGRRVVRGEFQLRLPNGAETTDERYIGRGSRQLVRTNYLTGAPESSYGTLDLNEIGEWSYTLDGSRPAVMALGQGQRVRDEFTIRTDRPDLYPPATLVVEVIGDNNTPSARVTADRNEAPTGTVINLRGVGGDADPGDEETLSYTWSLSPVSQGGRFGDRSARDTTWTVGNRGPGAKYTLRLRVTDQGGAFGSDTVVITQVAAQARVLSGVLQGGVTEDGDATISGAVSEPLHAVDERGVYGRFRVVAGAAEWSYTLDNGPAVQRLAAGQQVREKNFAITPQDAGIAAAAVAITVTGANDPPTAEITAPATSVTVMPGDVVALFGDGADTDAADALFFLWSVSGEGGDFSDLSTARTTWTAPQVAVPTDFVVSFKVSDGRLSDTDFLAVAVEPPPLDAAPVFVARSVLDQSYTRGATITPLSLPQAAGGNGELIYTLSPEPLPQGLSFDSLTRILFGTPQVSQPLATYTYTVVDGDANNDPTDADTLRFTITIPDAGINRGTPAFLAAAADRIYTTGTPIIPLDLPAAAGGTAPLRYTLEPDLPAGLIFDALARRVSGTPQALSPPATYTYTVTDALEATDALDFDLSVEAPPDVAPVFAAGARIADQEYAVDTAITALRLPAAANGNGALRYGIAPPLPDGLVFDDGTRLLSGAPTTPQDALTYTYAAVDTDDNQADTDRAVLRFTISVDGAPDFGAQRIAAQQYIAERAIASLTLPAASGGNALLVYALPNLPGGLSFDGAARVLSGTPAAASELRSYVYAVVDSDSNRGAADRDVLRFSITVLPPSAISGVPDVALSLIEDGAESELEGALGIISPPGGDATFVAHDGTGGDYGTFTLTAAGAWRYRLDDRVQALAGDIVASESFTVVANADPALTARIEIMLSGVNDAPTATISAPAANAQLASGGRLSLSGSGSDPDNGDRLEYTWSTIPADTGSFDDDSAAATMWTAPDSAVTVTLQLEVSDGTATATASVTGITVAPLTISGIATGAVTEDGTAAETMTGDTLTVSHPEADGDTTFVPQTDADGTYGLFGINAEGEWIYQLGGNADNAAAVNALTASARPTDTFTVAANADNNVTQEIIVTVNGANDRPTATINAPVTGTSAMFDEVITVTGNGADPDTGEAATLTYMWTTTPAGQGSFAAPNAASTTWTAGAQAINDTVMLSLTVTDTSSTANAVHSDTVAVTVMMTPLVINGTATGTVTEDGNAAAMMASNTLTITNPNPGNDVTFVTQTDADGAYGLFGITAQGVWTYTLGGSTENEQAVNALGASDSPTDTFTVMANDDNAVTQDITITVTGANDAPTATISAPPPNTPVASGGRLSLSGSGSDPDNGDSLEYTWSTTPADTGSFDDDSAAVTMWTAPDSAVTVTLQLEVSDGTATATASVTGITVAPITISGIATGAVTEDGTAAETMTGDTLTVSHPEADGDTTFVPQTDADGTYGLFGINAEGEWIYQLGGNADNAAAVNALTASARPTDTFTVAANADNNVTQEIIVTVNGANDRPTATISAPVTGTSAMFDEVITVTGNGADPDTGEAATLTYMWTTTPAGQGSFAAPNAASTTWTAGADAINDTVMLSLTVTDTSSAANASHSATVNVTVMMTPLVINGAATGTVTEDGNAAAMMASNTLTITNPNPGNDATFVTQTDADGDYGLFGITAQGVWTYTLGGNPANEQAVNALGASDRPADTFTVMANDDNAVTQDITITVTGANDAPTATISAPPPNTMAVFGGRIAVTGAGSDPDTGTALQYAWSTTPANTGSFANANAADTTWTAPDSGTATSVTLNLMVSDGTAATAATPVIIMVVPLAFSGDTTGALTEDSGPATATGALTIDNPAGGSEEFVAENLDGTYGLFSIGATGNWTYTIGGNAGNIAAVNALADGDAMDDVLTATSVVGPATQVTITITGTNDAPTAAISAPADGMDVEFGVVVTVTGSTSSDPDTGATLTYAWSTQPPDRGSFADAAAASTTWTASESGTAAVTLILTVTDDATPPATDSARVTVNPVAVEADFGGVITGTVVEAGTSAGTGTATGTLTITTGNTNKNVVAQTDVPGIYGRFSIAANRAWTYTLDDSDDDTNALAAGTTAEDTFTVTASVNPAATVDVTLTITGANDAPEVAISEPDAGNVLSGLPVTLRAAATDPDTGATLTYAWTTTPSGEGSFTNDANRNTTWTAPTLAGGTMDVALTLTVTDDARAPAAATVALTVEQPSITGPGIDATNPTATPLVLDEEGNRASGGIAEGTLTVTNAAGETPTHRITRQPMYGTVTLGAQTRNVDDPWTYTMDNSRPATKERGPDDFDTDSFGIQTTIGDITIDSVITITLNAGAFPDDPPTATAMINGRAGASATVEEGEMVTLTGSGTDPDSDDSMITYQWAYAPPQIVTFDPADGRAPMVTFMAPEKRTTMEFTLTATSEGRPGPALDVTVRVGRSQFDNVNRTILPEVTRAMMDTTVSAIARRTEQAATDHDAGATFSLGGQSTLAGVLQSNGEALTTGAFNVKSLLGRSAFALPLNQAGGPLAGVTLWGNGAYRNLSGNSATVDWDGDLFGATVGGDTQLTDTLLTGLAVSWADGTFDYTDRSGTDPAPGTYQATLTSLHPYVSTSLLDGQVTLWATGGYGWGEVEITDTADPTADGTVTADTRLATAAVGGAGRLLNQPGLLTPDGTTTVRVKAEALTTAIKAEQQGDRLAGLTTDARRLRLTLEGSHAQPLPHGAQLTPSVGVGLRHDAGDGRTGTGAEVSGGLRYAHPALRLTMESRGRVLLAHGGDYDDWSVSGRVTLAPGAQGQGLAVTLEPAYQTTTSASGLAQLWEHGTANRPAPSGPTTPQGLMEATVAYGLPVGDHLLTPYGGMTLGAADARTYRLGSRVSLAHRLNMSLEGARKGATGTAPVDHGVRVQLEWHW